MASTREVAQQAGVSIGTVSRVLNNKPGVSEPVRQRVLAVAHELSYSSLRRFPRPHVTHLGLLLRPFPTEVASSPFYADVYHGVEQVCREQHITLSFSQLDYEGYRLRALPPLLSDERIGIIALLGAIPPPVIEAVAAVTRVPLVLVDNWYPHCPWDTVMIDNAAGASAATEYLIEQGHSCISLIGGPDHPSIVERRQGYEQALRAHGLEPCVISQLELEAENGERAVEDLLRACPGTTAVMASNDWQAIGALKRLLALGLRVPDDISLIGFDDIILAQHTAPPLTTMRVDRNGMGRSAVELLLGRLSAPDRAPVRSIVGVTLVERATVAPPRTGKIVG